MPGLPGALFRMWFHSREEDAGGTMVYRPAEYEFPPARGRRGLEIKANGSFVLYEIAPTDGGLPVPGRWEALGADVIRMRFDDRQRAPFVLHIVSCTKHMLKVKRE